MVRDPLLAGEAGEAAVIREAEAVVLAGLAAGVSEAAVPAVAGNEPHERLGSNETRLEEKGSL